MHMELKAPSSIREHETTHKKHNGKYRNKGPKRRIKLRTWGGTLRSNKKRVGNNCVRLMLP